MSVREVVLVTGPPRAGVSAMTAALARRLPAYRFAEPSEVTRDDVPAAVVFVVSAVAPIVESDCALLDFAEDIDVVIGAVSKIDDHRDWRGVLAADRELLGRRVPWIGAAAAPRLGEPTIDELVGLVDEALTDPGIRARNALLARESRTVRLRDERERLVAHRRQATLDRARTLRGAVQQTRLDLTHAARRQCSALRADLLDEAAAVDRGDVAGFTRRARRRCDDVLADVGAAVAAHTTQPRAAPAAAVTDPPLTSRRLENRLMTVLGAGFGFGVALVVTRFVAGLAPGLAVAGLIAGSGVGLAVTVWVIRARALLHVRAVLVVWAGDVATAVRAAAEEKVATGMLSIEAAMASASAAAGSQEDAEFSRQIAVIEARIRSLGRPQEGSSLLPIGRTPGSRHLNRSCE